MVFLVSSSFFDTLRDAQRRYRDFQWHRLRCEWVCMFVCLFKCVLIVINRLFIAFKLNNYCNSRIYVCFWLLSCDRSRRRKGCMSNSMQFVLYVSYVLNVCLCVCFLFNLLFIILLRLNWWCCFCRCCCCCFSPYFPLYPVTILNCLLMMLMFGAFSYFPTSLYLIIIHSTRAYITHGKTIYT